MKQILVTGATGHLGGQVLKLLVEKVDPKSLSAIARDTSKLSEFKEKGVTIIQADYNDPASLVKAFQKIDSLYFVSGSELDKRMKQHENVVDAAKKAGVKHVVYTSFQRKNETEDSPIAMVAATHLQTEKWLKESGVNYTIMKHALYSEGVPMFLGEKVIENGMIYQPAGEGKSAFATRYNMAEAAVTVLTTHGHENKSYEISAGTAYSYDDIAKMLTEISGKQITYVSPSEDEFKKTLTEAGVPDALIGISALFAAGIKQGEFDIPDSTLEKLIGHKPEDLSLFLRKIYSKKP